jgi:hypothetical protein
MTNNLMTNNLMTNNLIPSSVVDNLTTNNIEREKMISLPIKSMDSNIIEEKEKIIKKKRYEAISSSDNEINSYGDREDKPFDMLSGESSDISTPYVEINGNYYCKDKSSYVSFMDVCSYSDATLFLLKDGNIICERNNNRNIITNNVILIKITSFNGYLYGLEEDNKLYMLSNDMLFSNKWMWNKVNWVPKNIKHISSTYDTKYLWIQTEDTGYLYDDVDHLIFDCYDYKLKRVYGRDVDNYIEIDKNKNIAIVTPGNYIIENIHDAVLSYYNEVVSINLSEINIYRGITVVNWRPYFIRY